ncbi:hypothetical protein ES703_07444 [subsurface metagenome]
MKKALNTIKHIWKSKLVIVCTLGVFIGISFFLDWVRDKYGQEYALTWVAVFIAAIAAIAALSSLKLTRDSLELTRATTRPFLTLTEAEYSPFFLKVLLHICNTGALPGNEVSIEILLIEPKDEEGLRKSITKTLPSVFPNEEKRLELEINPEFRNLIDSEVETIRCLVEIKYCWQEKECWTKRIIGWPSEREARQHPVKLEVLAEGSGWQ